MTADEVLAHINAAAATPLGERVASLAPFMAYGPEYRRHVAEGVHAALLRYRRDPSDPMVEYYMTCAESIPAFTPAVPT